MCGHRMRTPTALVERPAATHPEHRVGDADRERTVDLLRSALGEGLLEPEEADGRVERALSARTAGELASVVGDLPPAWIARHRRAERHLRQNHRARRNLPAHVRAYAAVMTLLTAIWLVAALTGGDWYPWPVWPALGWGIGLVSHARGARRPRLTPSS